MILSFLIGFPGQPGAKGDRGQPGRDGLEGLPVSKPPEFTRTLHVAAVQTPGPRVPASPTWLCA